MARERSGDLAGRQIPECERLVVAGGDEVRAVVAECDIAHLLLQSERTGFLITGQVPELEVVVAAGGNQVRAVGAEGNTIDDGDVALDGAGHVTGFQIPEQDCLAPMADRRERLAISGKRQARDRIQALRVPQDANARAGGGIPERDPAILEARGQGLAVRAEDDGISVAFGARGRICKGAGQFLFQRLDGRAGGGIPETHATFAAAGGSKNLAVGAERNLSAAIARMVILDSSNRA